MPPSRGRTLSIPEIECRQDEPPRGLYEIPFRKEPLEPTPRRQETYTKNLLKDPPLFSS